MARLRAVNRKVEKKGKKERRKERKKGGDWIKTWRRSWGGGDGWKGQSNDDRLAQITKMIRFWRMAIVVRWTEQNRNGKR